jgi:predicted pyridoxine 5'-phosphate oxidase superfamily flavin-nucleotide-binding protein
MNTAQRKFGEPHPLIAANVLPGMNAAIQEFIRNAPFAVMATSNKDGDCDASPRGGTPGFVKVLDNKTLLIPDICGNKLFNSSANIETNPKLGLVFIIPGCRLPVAGCRLPVAG